LQGVYLDINQDGKTQSIERVIIPVALPASSEKNMTDIEVTEER
jgi:hypothetical protein